MTLSLDTAFTAAGLQMLESLSGILRKAEAHCAEQGLPAELLTDARLAPDMWPFANQVCQTAHHTQGAVAGVHAGVFSPRLDPAPLDFASLHDILAQAIAALRAIPPGELDAMAARDMRFESGNFRLDFTVEDFLLSFSVPNLFFHTATAYAILRNRGVNIGKRDYIGELRLKTS